MKQMFHKLISIVMAFVVLFSTMSFTINMHYCGGILAETAILRKAKGCGMEMQNSLMQKCSVTKKNCCSDKQRFINGQDELQLSGNINSFIYQVFTALVIYTYINSSEKLNKKVISHKVYKPPLVVRHIYKIDETYLI